MICKVCGYETSENFSVCPYCREKNSSFIKETENSFPSSQIVDNNQDQSMNFNNAVFINRHINERIDIKDVKIPFGVNQDFIDKENSTSNKFIINEPMGGDFFPNEILPIIMIGSILLFVPSMILLMMLINFLNLNYILMPILVIYPIIYFIAMDRVFKLMINKTKVTFSSSGIEAESRKGKLFISREDIEDVFVKEIQGIAKTGRHKTRTPYIQYDMMIKLKKTVHFSSDNKDKNEIKLLKEKDMRGYLTKSDSNTPELSAETKKKFSYYIVQQIRKVFDL